LICGWRRRRIPFGQRQARLPYSESAVARAAPTTEDKDATSARTPSTFAAFARVSAQGGSGTGGLTGDGNAVPDTGEFKTLVRQRMAATGEKYTVAYRALLDAAASAVLPPGHRILPRIAAEYANGPAEPVGVRLHLWGHLDLRPDDEELADYLAADEDDRLNLVRDWLLDRIDDLIVDEELIREQEVLHEDQLADERARTDADLLGVTPDQYLWLSDRLTDEEFSSLSDEGLRQLLATEYTEFPAVGSVGSGR
jgi:hypothetical protein